MPCPDLGALRASLDDTPGAAPALHDHVRACPACSGALAELQRNAELAAPALALTAPADPPPTAVEAALARLEQRRSRLATASGTPSLGTPPLRSPAPNAPATPEPHPLATPESHRPGTPDPTDRARRNPTDRWMGPLPGG